MDVFGEDVWGNTHDEIPDEGPLPPVLVERMGDTVRYTVLETDEQAYLAGVEGVAQAIQDGLGGNDDRYHALFYSPSEGRLYVIALLAVDFLEYGFAKGWDKDGD